MLFRSENAPKKGVFTGAYVRHLFTDERIPVYLANFVVATYGTGAVMAVPAHDQRDFEFASKYGIPIRLVIQNLEATLNERALEGAYEEQEAAGRLVSSGEFSGLEVSEAKERMADYAERQRIGTRTVNYRLRDWGVSRQRYWGTPIPMIYCDRCGVVPVPEDQLPVMLPPDVPLSGKGASPLARVREFVETTCPVCGARARRQGEPLEQGFWQVAADGILHQWPARRKETEHADRRWRRAAPDRTQTRAAPRCRAAKRGTQATPEAAQKPCATRRQPEGEKIGRAHV